MRRSSCGFYELCSEIAGSVAWLPLQDPSFLLASGESLHDLTVVPVEQLLLRWLNTQLEEVRAPSPPALRSALQAIGGRHRSGGNLGVLRIGKQIFAN